MRWHNRLVVLLVLLAGAAAVYAEPQFPSLSGRVVDRAELLNPAVEARLTEQLAAHERASGEQVVVVTVPELGGYDIADYGYRLGRHWGIGQAGEDNGALLIVALQERKVRIEVGYGLEGRLTDAQSWAIINRIVLPAFKAGDYSSGIVGGVAAMLQVLGGTPVAAPEPRDRDDGREGGFAPIFFILLIIFLSLLRGGGRRRLGRGIIVAPGVGRGGFGGGFGGGGFSGGGGSFGGGGASGGW